MQELSPYTLEEQQEMRRLLIASGNEIEAWCRRLRRSADFLQSLSPAQAGIVAEQAAVIAADPGDYGDDAALDATRRRLAAVEESERSKYVWQAIVALRRRHYPDLPEEL
ncbi:MAG TPA: hypothetical protein VK821_17420 [Dehalococcoidia bacterium]|nr:hypothetical protein [Dehalococcoidia bacterium]